MKLNEAIEHLSDTLNNPEHDWNCEECKEEHEQLLLWLMEYRDIIGKIKSGEYRKVNKTGISKQTGILGDERYFCKSCYQILPSDVIDIAKFCPICGDEIEV